VAAWLLMAYRVPLDPTVERVGGSRGWGQFSSTTAHLPGFPTVSGGLAVPELKRVFASGVPPHVLAFDPALEPLYVATESESVSIFQLGGKTLRKLEDLHVAPAAHTISVDPEPYEVYLPIKNVNGHPVLRIMKLKPAASK